MKKEFISIFAIFLGLINIILPALGFISANSIIGLSVLLIAIFLLILGSTTMDSSKWGSILYLILGIILLLLSIFTIFNTGLFVFITKFMPYLLGIFLVIIGVITLINNRMSKYGFIRGIVTILIGVIYLVIGFIFSNTLILGYLIGFWLIIIGIIRFIDRYSI